MRRSRSRSRVAPSARSTPRRMRTRTSPSGIASCRRWRRCSRSRSTAAGWSRRRSRPRRCAAATSSRRRCCARSRTTCARRSRGSRLRSARCAATTLVFSDEDRRVLLDTIAVDAERLGRLVGDLLDLSRLEAGGAEPEAEVWALDELVREAVQRSPGRATASSSRARARSSTSTRCRSSACSRTWSRTR